MAKVDDSKASASKHVDSRGCCGASMGTTILYVIFAANFALSITEVVAFRFAGSLVLLSDASHMVLDNVTYAINIWARRKRDGLRSQRKKGVVTQEMLKNVLRWEVGAAMLTAAVLLGSAIAVTGDAIYRLASTGNAEAPDGNIMLGVAMLSLIINGSVLISFFAVPALRAIPHSHGGQECSGGHDSNMFAAYAHLLADQFTTSIMLVVTVLIHFEVGDPASVDAIGSLVGCAMTGSLAVCVMRSSYERYLSVQAAIQPCEHASGEACRFKAGSMDGFMSDHGTDSEGEGALLVPKWNYKENCLKPAMGEVHTGNCCEQAGGPEAI